MRQQFLEKNIPRNSVERLPEVYKASIYVSITMFTISDVLELSLFESPYICSPVSWRLLMPRQELLDSVQGFVFGIHEIIHV